MVIEVTGLAIQCNLSGILGKRRIKMTDLARKAGIAYGTVFALYHEKAKGVTFEVMDKICEALACQPGELFEKVEGR